MTVTFVGMVTNRMKDRFVHIWNAERPGLGWITIPPLLSKALDDFPIPWCTSKGDFAGHHIELAIPKEARTYTIWQHHDGGNDRIRYSVDSTFHSESLDGKPADVPNGDSLTGSYRELRVYWPAELLLVGFAKMRPIGPADLRFG